MNIDGSTQLVAVFGSPVAHSASPAMHNAAFAALKMNWAYLACHVEPQNLHSALAGIRDMNFRGVNLTVPHKTRALEIVDEVDPEARKLGALNTVVVEAGKLRGFNTDGYGFAKAIKEDFNMPLKGKRVLVIGAGGAGRTIATQCLLEGAAKVIVANRTQSKIQAIVGVEAISLKDLPQAIVGVDLLVNATSVGLKPGETLPVTSEMFSPKLAVYDVIYQPAETALIRQANDAGAKVANGLNMLLHQGAKAFELWTKRKAPLTVMRRALRTAVYGESA